MRCGTASAPGPGPAGLKCAAGAMATGCGWPSATMVPASRNPRPRVWGCRIRAHAWRIITSRRAILKSATGRRAAWSRRLVCRTLREAAMTIRALIVDDEPLARRRIRGFLRAEPDVEIVGECRNGG